MKAIENERPEQFHAFIEEQEGTITELHMKYDMLVWYARSNPKNWDRPKVMERIKLVEGSYPQEVKDLKSEDGEWHHGFNSGMLACLRLMDYPLGVVDGLKEFPFLDT